MTTSVKTPESSIPLTPLVPPMRKDKHSKRKFLKPNERIRVERYKDTHLSVVKGFAKAYESNRAATIKNKLAVAGGVLAVASVIAYMSYADRGFSKNQMAKMKYVDAHMTESGPEGLLQKIEPGILNGEHEGQVESLKDAINSQKDVNSPEHDVIVPVPNQYEDQARENNFVLHSPNS